MTVKSSRVPPIVVGYSAEIIPIASGVRRTNEAMALKPKPEQIVATGYGSGWYHDAAIQQLKKVR